MAAVEFVPGVRKLGEYFSPVSRTVRRRTQRTAGRLAHVTGPGPVTAPTGAQPSAPPAPTLPAGTSVQQPPGPHVLHVNYHMDSEQEAYVAALHPGYRVVVGGNPRPHGHPCAAAERLISGHEVIRLARDGRGVRRVLDVGARRNVFGNNVDWLLMPTLTPADVVARARAPPPRNSCPCTLENCLHIRAGDALLLQHVLYYVSRDDLISALLTTKTVAFATVHRFSNFTGTLCNGELRYTRVGPDAVEQTTAGGETFQHSPLDWLGSTGSYSNGAGTLCWNHLYSVGDTDIYCFALGAARAAEPVATWAVLDRPDSQVGATLQLGVTTTAVFSGGAVWLTTEQDGVSVPVPRGLISHLALCVVGTTRDPKHMAILAGRARAWCRDNQSHFPETLLPHAIAVACAHAYTWTLETERTVYGSLVERRDEFHAVNTMRTSWLEEPRRTLARAVVDITQHCWENVAYVTRVYGRQLVFLLLMLMLARARGDDGNTSSAWDAHLTHCWDCERPWQVGDCIWPLNRQSYEGWFGWVHHCTVVPHSFADFARRLLGAPARSFLVTLGAVDHYLVVMLILAVWPRPPRLLILVLTTLCFAFHARASRAAVVAEATTDWIFSCICLLILTWHAVRYVRTHDTKLEPGPVRSGAVVVPSIELEHHSDKTGVATHSLVGPMVTEIQPTILASSAWNEQVGMTRRCAPAGLPELDDEEFRRFEQFATLAFPVLFPPARVRTMAFETWAARFSQNTRCMLHRARDDWLAGHDLTSEAMRITYFTKMELGFKEQDESGLTESKPRIISSAAAAYNVIVGPWIAALQARIKLHHHAALMICESSRRVLGRWFARHASWLAYECDFSTFDATQHARLRLLVLQLLQRFFRMPADVYRLMEKRANLKKGWGVRGTRFRCAGTMASGDPDTYLGNTILNVLLQLYAYCRATGVTNLPVLLRSYTIAAAGDDSLAFARVRTAYVSGMEATLRRLGMVAKFLVHSDSADWTDPASFCSSYFIPVGETWWLSPKPARIIAKMPWVKGTGNVAELRGNALGVWDSVVYTPFAREYVARILQLTDGTAAAVAEERHTFRGDAGHDWWNLAPLDETTQVWVEQYYGVTQYEYAHWVRGLRLLQLRDVVQNDVLATVSERDL